MTSLDAVRVVKLHPGATIPTKAHAGDAGWDLHSLNDVVVPPGRVEVVGTGLALAIPAGHYGQIAERSGLGARGIAVRGGVVDAGYRGEIMIILHNLGGERLRVLPGQRIAQLIIIPIGTMGMVCDGSFDAPTSRGTGGLGSTGL